MRERVPTNLKEKKKRKQYEVILLFNYNTLYSEQAEIQHAIVQKNCQQQMFQKKDCYDTFSKQV